MVRVIGIDTDETIGKIPQTDGCVGCDKAYATSDDFACPPCTQSMGEEAWDKTRIQLLESVES